MYFASLDEVSLVSAAHDAAGRGLASLLLVGQDSVEDLPALLERVTLRGGTCFGGVFPRVVHGDQTSSHGVIHVDVPLVGRPVLVRGLDASPLTLPAFPEGGATAFVFADGLSVGLGSFMAGLYDALGHRVRYFGGGAGIVLPNGFHRRPVVFVGAELVRDAAVVALSPLTAMQGVRHGLRRISGPHVVTRVEGSTVHAVDWQPAQDVLLAAASLELGRPLGPADFREVALAFAFGLATDGAQDRVRVAIAPGPDGSLLCGGDVHENAVLYVLRGTVDALVDAARDAADASRPSPECAVVHRLCADCTYRYQLLGVDHARALAAMAASDPDHVLEGALTLGEISSGGDGYLELLNETVVVATLCG